MLFLLVSINTGAVVWLDSAGFGIHQQSISAVVTFHSVINTGVDALQEHIICQLSAEWGKQYTDMLLRGSEMKSFSLSFKITTSRTCKTLTIKISTTTQIKPLFSRVDQVKILHVDICR
jgi:hypothetical protein